MIRQTLQALVCLAFAVVILGPIFLALERLTRVTDSSIFDAWDLWKNANQTDGVLSFTLLVAFTTSCFTCIIGFWIASTLAKYEIKHVSLIRAFFVLPFVTPAIVAAVGFLAIIDSDSILSRLGIDLYTQSGFIGKLGEILGAENLGNFIALILALSWFNISLVIRLIEPMIARLDKDWEDQFSILPKGDSTLFKLRYFYLPIYGPGIFVAWSLTFIFSFTSFALPKWLSPQNNTIETLVSIYSSSAGIEGYRVWSSELVLSATIIQFLVLGIAMSLSTILQSKHNSRIELVNENYSRKQRGKLTRLRKIGLSISFLYVISPLVAVLSNSFRSIERTGSETVRAWSFEGWRVAWRGDLSYAGIPEAMTNSVTYAIVCMAIALIVGTTIAASIKQLEDAGRLILARIVDFVSFLPLIVSAITVGLGILIGLLNLFPELLNWRFLPVWAHIMMVCPFVVRIMLPAFRSLDQLYSDQATVLGMTDAEVFWKIKIPLLKPQIIVSAALSMAFSLGEFGASWMLSGIGNWVTLSTLTDQLMSRPNYFPEVRSSAMAVATCLMLMTLILFTISEKFRDENGRGGF
ncbi:MAG: ABC transporter permease [Candidatus Poseidoniaceae archaeon]